ncbi:MAG: hypothetical protein QG580_327 [Patescibacteria group bacterium]|jgi:hypothetical protein|nr:hypothetical protein [Patescibacteria group bacterium]
MFEKWFGGKKKLEGINSDKNSMQGVAHFDGTKTEKDLLGDENDYLQDEFDKNDSVKKVSDLRQRDAQNFGTNWRESSMKVSNERNHPKLGEKHSDWKEKEPFALDLPEDDKTLNEKHLNAMAERYDDEDDFEDMEKAA